MKRPRSAMGRARFTPLKNLMHTQAIHPELSPSPRLAAVLLGSCCRDTQVQRYLKMNLGGSGGEWGNPFSSLSVGVPGWTGPKPGLRFF